MLGRTQPWSRKLSTPLMMPKWLWGNLVLCTDSVYVHRSGMNSWRKRGRGVAFCLLLHNLREIFVTGRSLKAKQGIWFAYYIFPASSIALPSINHQITLHSVPHFVVLWVTIQQLPLFSQSSHPRSQVSKAASSPHYLPGVFSSTPLYLSAIPQ